MVDSVGSPQIVDSLFDLGDAHPSRVVFHRQSLVEVPVRRPEERRARWVSDRLKEAAHLAGLPGDLSPLEEHDHLVTDRERSDA